MNRFFFDIWAVSYGGTMLLAFVTAAIVAFIVEQAKEDEDEE